MRTHGPHSLPKPGEYRLRYLPSDGEGGAGGTAVLRAWHEQMKDMLMPSTTESHDSMIERAMVFQQGALYWVRAVSSEQGWAG